MTDLIKAAGCPRDVLGMIPNVVDTCRICRDWERPGLKSVATSTLSTRLNERVQFDLLFIEELVVNHLIDESTRFSMCIVIPSREDIDIIRSITQC